MKVKFARWMIAAMLGLAAGVLLAGCGGGDGESKLVNKNPGINDLNVVVAFGDSVTAGVGDTTSYPRMLTPLIGKTVRNAGIRGSKATDSVGRTQELIDRYHPAYMFILYGINDIFVSRGIARILGALDDMVVICKENNVLPVLATYPMLHDGYEIFAYPTLALNQGIRDLAKAQGIRCVDLEKEFSNGRNPDNPDLPLPDTGLYLEGLHPNNAGNQVIALAFADLF